MASKPLATKLRDKRNSPPEGGSWFWMTREMLESEAWCSLSLAARRVLDRVVIEHMAHAGQENGNLVVTYDDFVKFGIRRTSIKPAIDECVERGLLIVTLKGRANRGFNRWPSKYALGWLPFHDGSAARNRWKGWRPIQEDTSTRGHPTADAAKIEAKEERNTPTPHEGLPEGFHWCSKSKRVVTDDGVVVPLVDNPLVGNEKERAAYRALADFSHPTPFFQPTPSAHPTRHNTQDIESSNGNDTGQNGGNPTPPVTKAGLASSDVSVTGKSRNSAKAQSRKRNQGKKLSLIWSRPQIIADEPRDISVWPLEAGGLAA